MSDWINKLKHDGEQEALRKKISSVVWDMKNTAEKISWQSKSWRSELIKIKKLSDEITQLFNELD